MIVDILYGVMRVSVQSLAILAVMVGAWALYTKRKIRLSVDFYKAQGIPFHY